MHYLAEEHYPWGWAFSRAKPNTLDYSLARRFSGFSSHKPSFSFYRRLVLGLTSTLTTTSAMSNRYESFLPLLPCYHERIHPPEFTAFRFQVRVHVSLVKICNFFEWNVYIYMEIFTKTEWVNETLPKQNHKLSLETSDQLAAVILKQEVQGAARRPLFKGLFSRYPKSLLHIHPHRFRSMDTFLIFKYV